MKQDAPDPLVEPLDPQALKALLALQRVKPDRLDLGDQQTEIQALRALQGSLESVSRVPRALESLVPPVLRVALVSPVPPRDRRVLPDPLALRLGRLARLELWVRLALPRVQRESQARPVLG